MFFVSRYKITTKNLVHQLIFTFYWLILVNSHCIFTELKLLRNFAAVMSDAPIHRLITTTNHTSVTVKRFHLWEAFLAQFQKKIA